MKNVWSVWFLLVLVVSFSACRKETFIKDSTAKLQFSTDTVLFDTVFTTLGSTTQFLQVYNPYNQKIKIGSIRLAGGNSSQFRINVDGTPGVMFNNIEIEPKDSLYIFVQVTVNPLNSNSPLVVQDSVIFETNGNIQDVDLVAWGQDAVYYYPDNRVEGLPPFSVVQCDASGNAVWKKDKPIVIFDYCVVDSACKLTIEPGTQIHFYTKSSGLWVYKYGCIKANGTVDQPIVFQGGRLEQDYKEVAGQWDRIWINEGSVANEFSNCVIKNGFIGLQAEVLSDGFATNQLVLNNVHVRNMTGWGILSRFYNITGNNTIVSNTSNNSLALTYGGQYKFTHCTFANYWSYNQRKNPVLLMNNYASNQVLPFNATFLNCIIYGDKENEIESYMKAGADSTYVFDHCDLKVNDETFKTASSSSFISILKNQDPAFAEKQKEMTLSSSSSCLNYGSSQGSTLVPKDFTDKMRDSAPDLGAREQ